MNATQRTWLDLVSEQAEAGQHIYPTMAACEAALESTYGQSGLAIRANNLFGTKQHKIPTYQTLTLPTREFINETGQWITVQARWVKYPAIADCFTDRMATLHRLAQTYPHYSAALAAPDAETFVHEVSQTWSTDPDRATKVLAIHQAYIGV